MTKREKKLWDRIDNILGEIEKFTITDLDIKVDLIHNGYKIILKNIESENFLEVEFLQNNYNITSSSNWGNDIDTLIKISKVTEFIKNNEDKYFEWQKEIINTKIAIYKL